MKRKSFKKPEEKDTLHTEPQTKNDRAESQ